VGDESTTLHEQLQRVQAQIAHLESALEQRPDYGLGEGDPAVTDWQMNRVLLRGLQDRAGTLERALHRTDEGSYGLCEQCGQPIHPDRLAVLPGAKVCIRCAREREPA
jgi:RNA polymerase-binding transcription factor DksA